MNKKLILTCLVSIPSLLWAANETKPLDADQAEYQQRIQAAKKAYQQALVHKNVWRDTQKMITSAEQAAQQDDYQTAQQLATQAEQQALNAIQQSQQQAGVGNPDYLY